jgi:hypothetical protein
VFALWAPYFVQKKIREEHAAERAERMARKKT